MARRRTRQQDRLTGRTMLPGGGAGVAAHSYDLARARQASQDTADRTIVTGVIELT